MTRESLGDFPEASAEAIKKNKSVQNPNDVSGIPAYVVSKNAASKKVERECQEQIFGLKNQVGDR